MSISSIIPKTNLVDRAGKQAFNDLAGTPLDTATPGYIQPMPEGMMLYLHQSMGDTLGGIYVPGDINTTSVVTPNPASPATIAATQLTQAMIRQNTNTLPYDAVDVGMYLQTVDSMVIFAKKWERILNGLNTNSEVNKYFPKYLTAMLTDNQVGFSDLTRQQKDLQAELNTAIKSMNSLFIPAMPYTTRHIALMDSLYTDQQSDRAQVYGFDFPLLRVWNGYKYTTGTCCENYPNLTIKDFHTFIDRVYELSIDKDFTKISADMEKASKNDGSVKRFIIDEVSLSDTVNISYDREILELIHNSFTTCDSNKMFETIDINTYESFEDKANYYGILVQSKLPDGQVSSLAVDAGDLVQIPYDEQPIFFDAFLVSRRDRETSIVSAVKNNGLLFDMTGNDPSELQVVSAQSLISLSYENGVWADDTGASSENDHVFLSLVGDSGTEILYGMKSFRIGVDEDGTVEFISSNFNTFEVTLLDNYNLYAYANVSRFTMFPKIYIFDVEQIDLTGSISAIILGEVDTYRLLSYSELKRTQKALINALYTVF